MRPRLLRLFVVLAAMMLPLVGAAVAWGAEKQTITLTITPEPGVFGARSDVSATASSGLTPVTLETSTPTVCSLSQATAPAELSYKKAGKECTVIAKQAGGGEFLPAEESKSFTVAQGSQTVVFTSRPENPKIGGTYEVAAEAAKPTKHAVTAFEVETPGVCTVVGAKVTFNHAGECVVIAKEPESTNYKAGSEKEPITVPKEAATINFSTPPNAVAGGAPYAVSATAGPGQNVVFAISPNPVCALTSPNTVNFTNGGVGAECAIEATAEENGDWATVHGQQKFKVKDTQTIEFKSEAPQAAVVGGSTYTVAATGGASGEPVTFTIAETSASVCSISGTTVSFIGAGTCTIDANQNGNESYVAAEQKQQSFTVVTPTPSKQTFTPTPTPTPGPTPKPTPAPPPPVTFTLAASSFDPTTGRITFYVAFNQPGSFSWLFTFPNGKFGVYTAQNAKCASGSIKLNGRCRPAKITFAAGHSAIPGVGRLKVWFKPSTSGMKALKTAMKKGRPVLVSATFTFVPTSGRTPVSQSRTFSVKLKKH